MILIFLMSRNTSQVISLHVSVVVTKALRSAFSALHDPRGPLISYSYTKFKCFCSFFISICILLTLLNNLVCIHCVHGFLNYHNTRIQVNTVMGVWLDLGFIFLFFPLFFPLPFYYSFLLVPSMFLADLYSDDDFSVQVCGMTPVLMGMY